MSDPTIAEVYRTVLRIEKVLLTGNGTPPLVTIVAKLEEQGEAMKALLAYDRQQIDALREASRVSIEVAQHATRNSSKWGATAGGIVTLVTAALIGITDALVKR